MLFKAKYNTWNDSISVLPNFVPWSLDIFVDDDCNILPERICEESFLSEAPADDTLDSSTYVPIDYRVHLATLWNIADSWVPMAFRLMRTGNFLVFTNICICVQALISFLRYEREFIFTAGLPQRTEAAFIDDRRVLVGCLSRVIFVVALHEFSKMYISLRIPGPIVLWPPNNLFELVTCWRVRSFMLSISG